MARQHPPLEVDPQALAAIDLAIEQAKRLRHGVRRAPSIWLCCLELARVEVAAGRPPRIATNAIAASLKLHWHVRYFRDCKDWHAHAVLKALRRQAADANLFPLGIDYDPGGRAHHVEPELVLIRLPRLRSRTRAVGESEPSSATAAPPAPPRDDGGTAPPQDDNDESLLEERFIARFGFDAPPVVRAQVLRLKRANQWTDRTIRYLRRTGALTVRGSSVECRANFWMPSIGVVFLIGMALPLLHAVLAFYQVPVHDLTGNAKVMAMILGYLAVCWMIHYVFIRPFLFLRRARLEHPS